MGPAKQTLRGNRGQVRTVGHRGFAKRGIALHIPTEKEGRKDIRRPAQTHTVSRFTVTDTDSIKMATTLYRRGKNHR